MTTVTRHAPPLSSDPRIVDDLPGGRTVRVRSLPPKLIRLLERRATKDGRLDPNEFEILKFAYGVVEPSFTVAEVRRIFRKFGRTVRLVLDRIDALSGCDVRVHADPRLPFNRQVLRTAALIMDASRRLCDERRLHRARPRARRARPIRHRGSRRTAASRAGPGSADPHLGDEPPGERRSPATRGRR